ncbi:MAG: hypothetical protein ABI895_30345 [Deltaproteobacteria bacterium]
MPTRRVYRAFSPWAVAALLALGAMACGGDDPEEEDRVSTSSPDELSKVLVIPGAVRVQGQPPAASPATSADVPKISGGSGLSVSNGGQAVLRVQYESPTGYNDCFVQVQGARDYFRVGVGSSVQTGTLEIPVNLPDNVDAGSFSLYTCIAGDNGSVSNPISTAVSVTRSDAPSPSTTPPSNTPAISSSCQQAIESARQTYASIAGGDSCGNRCIDSLYTCYGRNNCMTIASCGTTAQNCIMSCA